jgi:hypothetical protein
MTPRTVEAQRVLPIASPESANVEVLFKEAKRRERRRRLVAISGLIVVLAIVPLLILVLAHGSPDSKKSASASGQVQSTAPTPAFYVAHVPTQTAELGAIEAVRTSTGQVVRQLGQAYDPYPENGFQLAPNGSKLYYVQLNEAQQKIEIVAVSVDSGATNVIAVGSDPQISPNGMRMVFEPEGAARVLEVMNLRSKGFFKLHVPITAPSQRIFGVSWLPGSQNVIVTIGTPNRNAESDCRPQVACPTFPTPPPPVSYVAKASSGAPWVRAPSPSGVDGGWKYLTLEGAGPRSGTVLVLKSSVSSNASDIETEQVTTGRILSSVVLPANTTFLARDPSATHFLVSSLGLSATESWSPSTNQLKPLGPLSSEASW